MVNVLLLLGGLLIPILVGLPGQGPGTTTTTTMDGDNPPPPQSVGGEPGDPCDPETYDGPYSCVPDPNGDGSGYIIAD